MISNLLSLLFQFPFPVSTHVFNELLNARKLYLPRTHVPFLGFIFPSVREQVVRSRDSILTDRMSRIRWLAIQYHKQGLHGVRSREIMPSLEDDTQSLMLICVCGLHEFSKGPYFHLVSLRHRIGFPSLVSPSSFSKASAGHSRVPLCIHALLHSRYIVMAWPTPLL